jgi:plastocyanin
MPAIRSSRSIRTLARVGAGVALTVATLAVSPGARAGTTHDVQISGFAFAPLVLTVTVGDTVRWTNLDAVTHTATSTSGAFDSGDLDQNESFSVTFTAAGTYAYICTPHPSMAGTVIVEAAPDVAPTAGAFATATPVATAAPGGGGLPNVATPALASPPRPALVIGLVLLVVGGAVAARRSTHRNGIG